MIVICQSHSSAHFEGQMWICEKLQERLKNKGQRIKGQRIKGQDKSTRCTETIRGVGTIKLWVRHNTFMRISMKALGADQRTHIVITQHILVMMTLHMNLTFTIHVGITQCAGVSKLMHCDFNTFIKINIKAFSVDVLITKYIQMDQKHCPDVSKWKSQHIHGDCISSAIVHMAPRGDPRQRNSCVHMTSWEGHTRLIRSGDDSDK